MVLAMGSVPAAAGGGRVPEHDTGRPGNDLTDGDADLGIRRRRLPAVGVHEGRSGTAARGDHIIPDAGGRPRMIRPMRS